MSVVELASLLSLLLFCFVSSSHWDCLLLTIILTFLTKKKLNTILKEINDEFYKNHATKDAIFKFRNK
jgi:hypothetical protein